MKFRAIAGLLLATALGGIAPARAANGLHVGRTGVATALPPLPVPPGTPCVVTLFSHVTFTDAEPRRFRYRPPQRCRGPWARVVLQTDWSVSAGRQFDRTVSLWLGNVALYFGSTQEPSAKLAPHWRVRRDVTDDSAWLRRPHAGHAMLFNVVNATYTGVITGSAKLLFYPGTAPRIPDRVISLATRPGGGLDTVEPGHPRAGRTLHLPRNMVALALDVYAQSQAGDEFWAFCVPDRVAKRLKACDGSGFRQTMVYIDGRPAGVAPVYPWIYSGGAGPALWRPIPGVQTLDFRPFRVNLTPFAGVLDDGKPHTIALGVVNAQKHFALAANLRIWQDPKRAVVTGAVTRNTLAGDAHQRDRIQAEGAGRTRVTTTARRDFRIAGYVDTSRGRVATAVHQRMDFTSDQRFTMDAKRRYRQWTRQVTHTRVDTRIDHAGVQRRVRRGYGFALHFDDDQHTGARGTRSESMRVLQSYARRRSLQRGGKTLYRDAWRNTVTPSVRYLGRVSGGKATVRPWTSAQHVTWHDSLGTCFDRRIRSRRHALVSVTDGATCGGRNRVRWRPGGAARVDPHAPRGSEAGLGPS